MVNNLLMIRDPELPIEPREYRPFCRCPECDAEPDIIISEKATSHVIGCDDCLYVKRADRVEACFAYLEEVYEDPDDIDYSCAETRCPVCGKECEKIVTDIAFGGEVLGCENCLNIENIYGEYGYAGKN